MFAGLQWSWVLISCLSVTQGKPAINLVVRDAYVVREVKDVKVGFPRRREEEAARRGVDVERIRLSAQTGIVVMDPSSGPAAVDGVLETHPLEVRALAILLSTTWR